MSNSPAFQSLVLKLLLDNINCLPPQCSADEGDDPNNVIGWTLVLVLSLSLFFRAVLFNLSFKIGLRTALRFGVTNVKE